MDLIWFGHSIWMAARLLRLAVFLQSFALVCSCSGTNGQRRGRHAQSIAKSISSFHINKTSLFIDGKTDVGLLATTNICDNGACNASTNNIFEPIKFACEWDDILFLHFAIKSIFLRLSQWFISKLGIGCFPNTSCVLTNNNGSYCVCWYPQS